MHKSTKRSVNHAQVAADEPVELEKHIILRLPPEPAERVRKWIEEGGTSFKDKLFIQFQPDMRHAQIRVGRDIFHGKLVDLPCVTETLKTLDKKVFYKVADVAQMLVCKVDPDETDEEQKQKDQKKAQSSDAQGKDPKKKDKQYQWPHGVTPALKNVRKRRFRKTLKKKYMDAPELEKELKRLLREDMEAVNVRYEIITAEQEMQQKAKMQKRMQQHDQQGASTSASMPVSMETMLRVDELFGDGVSSSSDEVDSNPASEVEPIPDSDTEGT